MYDHRRNSRNCFSDVDTYEFDEKEFFEYNETKTKKI